MGFFQREPLSTVTPYYTIGQTKTVLLVGLGNVGKQYDGTRHNVGFFCIDHFVAAQKAGMSSWTEKKDLKCLITQGQLGDTQVIAIKPTTFMNLSGEAVQAVSHFYKIPVDRILVVHDELDIPFGQIRLRVGGASAGHNGIKSVTAAIGEEYARVRVGVGPKRPENIDSADFVLQKFPDDEQKQLANLAQEAASILTEYIYSGQLPHDTRSFIV